MVDERVSLNLLDGTERVLALNELSHGFRKRFYVHVASTRKLLMIESSPPLRILECTDSFTSNVCLDANQAPWVIATRARNLFALWDPSKKFDVSFLDTKKYIGIHKTAYSSTRPEIEMEAQKLALQITAMIERSLKDDKFIIDDFASYKEEVKAGESDPQEDMQLAAIDGFVVFVDEKGKYDTTKDHRMKLEKGYCARLARRAAEEKLTSTFSDMMQSRALLKCILGFAKYNQTAH
jgi:hypothetical protein